MNFQESMTILNADTKKSGNLSYAPRILKIKKNPRIFDLEKIILIKNY